MVAAASRGGRCRLWIGIALAIVAGAAGNDPAVPAPPLSDPRTAWRGDPRPPADVPEGVDAAGRRSSWRAQRRAARRGRVVSVDERPAAPEAAAPATAVVHLVHRDQPYAAEAHPRQRFDIHLPTGCAGQLPLVVWIHGDEWRTGSKADCPVTWLVDRGYAVASLGHRLSSDAAFPAPFDDVRAGLEAIIRDAELWGIDPGRVCIAGFGSGGQLAALVALVDQPLGESDPPPAAALVAIAAPTLLTALEPRHDRAAAAAAALVGGPLPEFREAAQRASPVVHASSDDPPTLLLHGRRDAEIPPEQARRLEEALRTAGVSCRLELLDAGHAVPLGEGSLAGRSLATFLEQAIGPGAGGGTP